MCKSSRDNLTCIPVKSNISLKKVYRSKFPFSIWNLKLTTTFIQILYILYLLNKYRNVIPKCCDQTPIAGSCLSSTVLTLKLNNMSPAA